MKRILFGIIAVLFSIIEMSAQVSFTPSTLTWSAEDTSPKTVTVHSPGWWDTDSTSHSSHFNLSRYNGWNGYEIEISPLSTNNSGGTITEDIPFTTPGSSGMSYLRLIHNAIANTLSVSPSSLSWAYNSTSGKTLSISCSGAWVAGTDAPWVQMSTQSGDGDKAITITPLTANPSASARSAVLYVRCGSSLVRSVTLSQSGNPSSSTIAVSPSTLVWDAGDTSPKMLSLASEGRWYTDSTGIHPGHFALGATSGSGDAMLSVWPRTVNPWYEDIVEELELTDEYGHSAFVTLRQRRRFTEDPADTSNTALTYMTRGSFDPCVNPDSLVSSVMQRQNPVSVSGYDAGKIPVTESTTPTGGRAYALKVPVAAGFRLVPDIGLAYNSQGGNGIAGYGWGLSGLSSISIIPKTRYWHGTQSAARTDDADAAWALDGVPLLDNEGPDLAAAYPLVSARGQVYAKAHRNIEGELTHFSVAYPDGTKATYGWNDNGGTKAVYPITEKTDRHGNRITFEYAQPEDGGEDYRVTAIRYGYNGNDAPSASILFTYEQRSDKITRYHAGTKLTNGYLLKGITSMNGAETLVEYVLTHELSEDASLLRQIGCSDGGNHMLPPVSFDYVVDECSGIPAALLPESTMGVVYDYEPGTVYQHVRGRFHGGQAADGVVSWPVKERYLDYGDQTFGSGYDGSENVSAVATLSGGGARQLTTEDGFQTFEAVDVDGDGIDELVKLNYAGVSGDNTRVKVTMYKFRPRGNPQSNSFTFTIGVNREKSIPFYTTGGMYNVIDFHGPAELDYLFGDYDGDGCAELVTVSTYSSYFNNVAVQSPRICVVDLNNGEKKYEGATFTHTPSSDNYRLLSLDLDADGRSELVRITGEVPTIQVFGCTSLSGGFSLENTWTFLPSSAWNHGGPFVTDVNGDGYLDFVVVESNGSVSAWCYTGAGYEYRALPGLSVDSSDELTFADVNHDGLPDALVRSGNGWMKVALNRNGCAFHSGDVRECYLGRFNASLVPFNLFDTYGISGVVSIGGTYLTKYAFTRDRSLMRLVRSSCDGAGNLTGTGYGNIMTRGANAVYSENGNRNYMTSDGYLKYAFPSFVVASTAGRSEDAIVSKNLYFYEDAAFNNRGLGFCGFGTVTATDYVDSTVTVNTFDPEKYGAVTAQATSLIDASSPFSSASYTYDSHIGISGKPDPRLLSVTSSDALTGVTATASYTYDTYDCPVGVTETRSTGSGSPIATTTSTVYSHCITPSLYLLGTPSVTTVTKGGMASKTEYTLDSLKRPTRTRSFAGAVSGGGTAWSLVEDGQVSYDARGNVTSDRTAKYGATTYNETTYTYDAASRYINSTTDPLGRTTTYLNYNKYGTPLTSSNWLGQNTVVSCDAWGNAVQTTYPDGTVETTTRAWSASGEPGVLCVTKTAYGRPTTKAWYDALGREVCSAEQRFDGVWMRSFTEYDTRGRVSRKSLPLRDDAHGSYLWNTYGYDSYDRPVSFTEASGKQTRWSYSGTSTTTTKDGMSSTSTTDAAGNVVSVTDGGGTITYALRDDGQPSGVTVTPQGSNQGVVTTFQYDAYGRRTAIIDPSAGTRTDSYTDNADGTSSIAHTGPNGTVTTSYDRFGRVTSVTRPEFITSYTYGTTLNSSSYGKLLSETSTNGTKKEYSYDVYGRIVTCKEWENAGRWLEATYSYNTDGTLSSVAFTSDRGYITTENYTYAYGTNTGINIPGTTVFSLTEENEIGLPTRVTTGGVGRLYGYTPTGLAASRRMISSGGAVIQDFGYTFDSLTGNLTQRTDGRWGSSYEFHYGGMDQLLDGMEYSANGNILQKGGYSLEYSDMNDPYKMTGSHRPGEFGDLPHHPNLSVGMTSFDRPSTITEGSNVTVFRYGADGNRVSMSAPDTLSGRKMERVYLGGTYERDITGLDATGGTTSDTKTVERLFLGGSAYDAPMVLVKAAGVNGGAWTPFNIGRNWQGSITHVATAYGTLVEEFAYSPWGEESTPDALDTLSVVDVVDFGDMEPVDGSLILPEYPGEGETELNLPEPLNSRLGLSLYVGAHGYTGHEHLWQYGLINCNARIYDPSVGRFLSPDPLVQDPVSTQNFNRYSYCLNNPLKYTDESGEYWNYVIGAVLGGLSNVLANWDDIKAHGFWTGVGYFGIGASIGFLSSGASIWTANAVEACGILAGSLVGSVSGALTGGGTATLTNGLNNWMHGSEFFDNWWQETKSSFISGAFSGAVSGGIQGYKYAKEHGASPFTNKVKGGDVTFKRKVKTGIPPQKNPEEYCYAHSAAYADAGHGNHTVDKYIKAANGAKGYDVSVLTDVSPSVKCVDGGLFSEFSDNVVKLGLFLNNPDLEMMATISGDENKHWVNIFKIVASEKMHLFGGGKSVVPSLIGYWDPATGLTNTTTYIIDYKLYKF